MLKQAVSSISELVGYSDNVLINQDFADVSAVMRNAGRAHMGVGTATGKDKAQSAAMIAVSSPLLETSINGATGRPHQHHRISGYGAGGRRDCGKHRQRGGES